VAWLLKRRPCAKSCATPCAPAATSPAPSRGSPWEAGGPRDLGALLGGLRTGETICALAAGERRDPLDPPPAEIEAALQALTPASHPGLSGFLAALVEGLGPDSGPAQARDGGFVAPGIRAELDQARALRDDSRRVIAALESQLVAESGVPLKIRHNAVLGYFLECTAQKGEPLLKPPLNATFIHRQTMAGAVRFTTVELAELDARIAQAGERALAIEVEAFEAWRDEACALAAALQSAAEALAALDVAAGLAEWAEEAGATRPVIDRSCVFEAEQARHPVVEAAVKRAGEAYTPNDCRLDAAGGSCPRLAIVTGPNMAGKSTFLRQNALMAVLAQAGSFVPAKSLKLGVVDRLFSRVGAGDDLARGRSTFMAEMVETAAILSQATPRSW
jgi:DNA mismatch repair protein MutS